MDSWIWFQSGVNTDGAHNPLTCRKLQDGDILSLNCFPMIDAYYQALERTAFLGNPSDAHLRYWKINLEVFEAGRKLLKPGTRLCDICHELNRIYGKHDVPMEYRTYGYGHSFGVLSHYYGRETILEIREDNTLILEPNMVVSMEPHITVPQGQPGAGGYHENGTFLITKDGNENLTNYKYGPEDMIIPSNAG